MKRERAKELEFPKLGYSDSVEGAQAGAYFTPASSNVIARLPYDPTFCGGSRPGLGRISDASFSDPRGVFVIRWKAEDGIVHDTLAVIDGGVIKIVDGSEAVTTEGAASTESKLYITTEEGSRIVFHDESSAAVEGGSAVCCTMCGKLFFRSGDSIRSYDPMSGAVADVLDDALGATSMRTWRGRLVLFGADNVVHFSAVLDPSDFDVGAHHEDKSKANSISFADAGMVGSKITAFMPVNPSTAYVATSHSLWRISGDVNDCTVVRVTDEVGVVSDSAWCRGDMDEIAFLSHDGMRFIRNDGTIESLDREVFIMPGVNVRRSVFAFTRPDAVSTRWLVGYDRTMRSYAVFASTDGAMPDRAWLVDEDRSAWPISINGGMKPKAIARIDGGALSSMCVACKDGVLRSFSRDMETDDGADIASAVAIGPVMHTTAKTEDSVLAELIAEFGLHGSMDGICVSVVAGRTSDEVVRKAQAFVEWIKDGFHGEAPSERARFRLREGWNHVVRPRVRGNAFAVIAWKPGGRWTYGGLTSVSMGCGRIRN